MSPAGFWSLLQEHSQFAVVGLLLLVALVQTVRLRLFRGEAGRRVQRHRALGAEAEALAKKLLVRSGYTIVGDQVSGGYELRVDGEVMPVRIRGDFLVQKRGRSYVAEVKGGVESALVTRRATRRQLLEYTLAFDVSGVLLVDVPGRKVRLVEFPWS